jgi:putative toxin-antitoxin system antitoxin component (TIGR02293 family)
MNKQDITNGKDSGPKDIKGKGNRFKDIKANGNGQKDSNSELQLNLLQEKISPEIKFSENHHAITLATTFKLDNQLEQLGQKLLDFILESKLMKFETPLNDDISLSDFFNNKLLIIKTIEKGIPFSIFESIKDVTTLTTNDWADYLGLSSRSLNRYLIQNKTFSPIYSEKIIELVEVFKLGLEVFGDLNSFNQWLNTPNFALGNIKPSELLKNSYGKEMVINELTGISHGILV